MSMKNFVKRLGIHDKIDYTLVSQVTLTRKNYRETSQGHVVLREYSNHVESKQA